MDIEDALINLGYVIYVGATLFKSNLALRITLVASSAVFIAYGIIGDVPSVTVWNIAFGALASYHVIRMLRERRAVKLNEVEGRIREAVFPQLSTQDFLYLWHLGQERITTEVITVEDEPVDELYLIVDGEVSVVDQGKFVADMGRHHFVGEMSLVSREPATATVAAKDEATLRVWSQDGIHGLERLRPDLAIVLWQILGRGLTEKVMERRGLSR